MSSTLSTLNTMTEVPLSKAPNPQTAPRAPQHKWLPTVCVCVCVCVCVFVHYSLLTAVCVHLDGLNAENKF